MKSILLAGATGLVGTECTRRLLLDQTYERVVIPTRRPLPESLRRMTGGEKIEERQVDFDNLEAARYDDMYRVDQVLCCLGTTIKKAGSQERFRQVDYGYPKTIAERSIAAGAHHFLLVSAIGADSDSRIFYNRVKGEIEDALLELPFRSTTIVRPSLLLGDRDEFRLGEEIASRLRFLFPSRYKPVHAADVARVLVEAARKDPPGRHIIESSEIPVRSED